MINLDLIGNNQKKSIYLRKNLFPLIYFSKLVALIRKSPSES